VDRTKQAVNVAVPVTANSTLRNPATAGFLMLCPCASDQRACSFPAYSLEKPGGVLRGSAERAFGTATLIGRGDQACGRQR